MKLFVQTDGRGRTYISDETGKFLLDKFMSPDVAAEIVGLVNVAPDAVTALEAALWELERLELELLKRLYLWNETQARLWMEKSPNPVRARITTVLEDYRRVNATATEG